MWTRESRSLMGKSRKMTIFHLHSCDSNQRALGVKRTRRNKKKKLFKSNDNLTSLPRRQHKSFIERGKMLPWHDGEKKIRRKLPKSFLTFFDSLVAQREQEENFKLDFRLFRSTVRCRPGKSFWAFDWFIDCYAKVWWRFVCVAVKSQRGAILNNFN